MCGYAVLHVNYRGSLGFGQDSLESLPGRIGRQDVDDCMAALQTCLDGGLVNKDRVYVLGGSHGGFLATHLIAQFPRQFCAAAARNPVVNIYANYLTCDIPDWCLSEVGTGVRVGTHDGDDVPSPGGESHALEMFRSSPVASIHRVRTPLLLLLGKNDKRVPMGQSVQYYYGLRSRGVETKMMWYDMSHALSDNVEQRANMWVNVGRWFMDHTVVLEREGGEESGEEEGGERKDIDSGETDDTLVL